VERLPEPLRLLAHADPLFWMIDGFRAGLIGHADGRPGLGLPGLALLALAPWLLALRLMRRGWRLRP
jgi:ABC-2 type transport system permease protein